MKSAYTLRAIKKYYNQKEALSIEGLELYERKIYTLFGLNGSGKSTLLHILAFLSKPCSGQLFYRNKLVRWKSKELLQLRREVTLVHQAPFMFEGNVYDNLSFGLKARGINKRTQRQTIAESLAVTGLEGFEQRRAKSLSEGEIQRVAIARALSLRPGVFLLDEPLSSVDYEAAEKIEKVIKALPAHGATVILATHDRSQPERLGSLVIHFEQGTIKGQPETLESKDLVYGGYGHANV